MNIFCAYPSYPTGVNYLLGMAYIMSYIREKGYSDITFVDGTIENISNEEIANIAQQKNVNIAFIGIPFTPMTDSALELLQYLRDRHIFTVVGGTMPTLMPEVFYEKANIIIVGDGEKASVKVLQNFENYKEEEASTVIHGEKIDDLDSVPYPAWDLYPVGKYSLTLYNEKERAMPVLINRGCPFRCTFCSNWFLSERKVRHRNVSSILDEIEHYMKDMHIYSFEFIAENMTLDKKFITDFDKEVENRHLKFKWWSGTRANMIDDTIAQEIKGSGCIGISYGGEGTYEVRKKIGKDIDTETYIKAIRTSREHGIFTYCSYILGFPWDTIESIKDTVLEADKIDSDFVGFAIFTPFPKTILLEMINPEQLSKKWSDYATTKTSFTPENLKGKNMPYIREVATLDYYSRKAKRMSNLWKQQRAYFLLFSPSLIFLFIYHKFSKKVLLNNSLVNVSLFIKKILKKVIRKLRRR